MARYHSFIIDGDMYEIRYVRKSNFDTMHIYKYNPKNVLFKRTLLAAPLVIDMMLEAQNHIDGKANNYYALLAQFSVRKVLKRTTI